jgi:hypothetical protein
VFTPDDLVDWNDTTPSGYLAAEIEVELSVGNAIPSVATQGSAPSLAFGESLAASDLAASGYEFSGVLAFGDEVLSGTLSWDNPSLIPGAFGFETDGQGNNAKDDGVFFASASFVPDEIYVGRYGSLTLSIPVNVQASAATRGALEDDVNQAKRTLPEDAPAAENYDPAIFGAYADALAAARAALAASDGAEAFSEGRAEQLLAAFEDARAALVHDHPVLENSAAAPITDKGHVVTIKVKGHFDSVSRVVFNGSDLDLVSTASPDRLTLVLNGTTIGSLSRGSAVVSLESAFVDALPNAAHQVEVYFTDELATGSGVAGFTVVRVPADDGGEGGGGEPSSDDDDEPSSGSNGGGGELSSDPNRGTSRGTPRTTLPGSTTSDSDSDIDDTDADDTKATSAIDGGSDSGSDGSGGNISTPEPGSSVGGDISFLERLVLLLPILIIIGSAVLAVVIMIIFFLRRRSRQNDNE